MREAGVPKYRLRVQERLVVLEFALRQVCAQPGRRFGFTSRTVRPWKQRWRAEGIRGLIPRHPVRRKRRIVDPPIDLVRHAIDFSYGSTRTPLWLWRVHRLRVSLDLPGGDTHVKPLRGAPSTAPRSRRGSACRWPNAGAVGCRWLRASARSRSEPAHASARSLSQHTPSGPSTVALRHVAEIAELGRRVLMR